MTSRSKQKIKFECTLAFDRQRLSFYIFLLYPGCVPIYIKKNWSVGGIHFLTYFLIFTSNPTIMTELMTLYDLGLHVFARWVDKLPATC